MKQKIPFAAERYGYSPGVVEAALEDIKTLEKMLDDLLELGPMCVCWDVVSRKVPERNPLSDYRIEGFSSLDHAVSVLALRLSGLRSTLTSDTDNVLTADARESRDVIVRIFLDRVKETYIDNADRRN